MKYSYLRSFTSNAVILLFLAVLAALPIRSALASEPCFIPNTSKWPSELQNVETANLFISVAGILEKSMKCRGNELECMERDMKEDEKKFNLPSSTDNTVEKIWADRLKKFNNIYPQQLYPDAIASQITPLIERKIRDIIPPGKACSPPKLNYVRQPIFADDHADVELYRKTFAARNAINFVVTVDYDDYDDPKIIILTGQLIRNGHSTPFFGLTPAMGVFPADLEKSKIKRRLEEFSVMLGSKASLHPEIDLSNKVTPSKGSE